MSEYTKAIIVVHRKESTDDFREIASRIKKLDSTICGAMVPEYFSEDMLPAHFLELPLLVVYLVNPPSNSPDQGIIRNAVNIAVEDLGKIGEYDHFREHNLPCLPIERFRWGMKLDPMVYGDWVVIKPENITSTGASVNMVPTKLVPNIKIEDFPENHLIHQDSYLVQKFIKTGESPTHYRVLVFLGEILYSVKSTQKSAYPTKLDDIKELLRSSVASNLTGHRTATLAIDEKMNKFALDVAKAFPDHPLLGVDVIKDENSDALYVLEVNLGGNTWAFSSEAAELLREAMGGRKAMLLQYGAWDRAAEALVRKTHELAK